MTEDIVIRADHLTKDYGHGRGIFDISFEVRKGEVFGYAGTNGSGKTTTIRNLMGFIQPDSGKSFISGKNSWEQRAEIMPNVSYIPGEIAFPPLSTGTDFLDVQAEYLGIDDYSYMNYLIQRLQLDPTARLKKMSKGMKQKTAIVAALMGHKEILVLDEPTTGLDPLMREVFLDLIHEEKKQGRTILMSSHIFEEIEDCCDRVAFIKDGRLLDVLDLNEKRNGKDKVLRLKFKNEAEETRFSRICTEKIEKDTNTGEDIVRFSEKDLGAVMQQLSTCSLEYLREEHFSMEEYFKSVYRRKGEGEDGTEN